MIKLIVFAAFVALVIIWAIRSRKANVGVIELEEDEEITYGFGRLKIISNGNGPTPTEFPNCNLTITNQRIIIAQKIVLSKKVRVHYYLWFTGESREGIFDIEDGIVNLAINEESFTEVNNKLQLIPVNAFQIKGLEIPLTFQQVYPHLPWFEEEV